MSRLTENFNLQRGLLHHLDSLPHVQLIQRTKVQSITNPSESNGEWPLVHLDNGRVLRSRLLVRSPKLAISFPNNSLARSARMDSIRLCELSLEFNPTGGHTILKPSLRLWNTHHEEHSKVPIPLRTNASSQQAQSPSFPSRRPYLRWSGQLNQRLPKLSLPVIQRSWPA